MKRKWILTTILVGIISITIIVTTCLIVKSSCSKKEFFEENWGIVFPKKVKLEYYIDSGESFHGDGKVYAVFVIKDQPQGYFDDYNEDNDGTIKNRFIEIVKSTNEKFVVEEDRLPEFSNQCRYFCKTDKNDERNQLIIIWNKDVQRMYLLSQKM